MKVFVKDERTGENRYFVYVTNEAGWTNFTGLRYSSYIRAEKVCRCIEKA